MKSSKPYLIILGASMLLFSCALRRESVVSNPAVGNLPDAGSVAMHQPTDIQHGTAVWTDGVQTQSQELQPALPTSTWADAMAARLDSVCQASGLLACSDMGVLVYDQTAGETLFSLNPLHRMRPASNMKVVTAVSALHHLGGNYRFNTEVRLTGDIADGVLHGDVYVVGGMDPTLSTNDVLSMAQALRGEGIQRIDGRLYADLSMKDTLRLGWGWCWDDDYGPLTPLMLDGKDAFAKAWVDALKRQGIAVANGTCQKGTAPSASRTVHTVSHSVDAVLSTMMKQSDNIYAESLFYALGAKDGRRGAGRKDAEKYVAQLLAQLGVSTAEYQIADGSGVSLYNYVTPHALVALLRHAMDTPDVYAHLHPSLPVAGVDGTLKNRMKGTSAQGNVHAKTGTVNGVSSLSGYATASNGHVLVFSIINQGVTQGSVGRAFQDAMCVELTR